MSFLRYGATLKFKDHSTSMTDIIGVIYLFEKHLIEKSHRLVVVLEITGFCCIDDVLPVWHPELE